MRRSYRRACGWFGEWWPEVLLALWVGGVNAWQLADRAAIPSLGVSRLAGETVGTAYTAVLVLGFTAPPLLAALGRRSQASSVLLWVGVVLTASGVATMLERPETAKGAGGAYVGLAIALMAIVWLRSELGERDAQVRAARAELDAAKRTVAGWSDRQ